MFSYLIYFKSTQKWRKIARKRMKSTKSVIVPQTSSVMAKVVRIRASASIVLIILTVGVYPLLDSINASLSVWTDQT